MKTLQRVIFPERAQMDTVSLYVDSGSATGVQLSTMNGALSQNDSLKDEKAPVKSSGGSTNEAHTEDFIGRRSTLVRPGTRLSFGTYFNAFPASYWKRWTDLTSVRLHLRLTAKAPSSCTSQTLVARCSV